MPAGHPASISSRECCFAVRRLKGRARLNPPHEAEPFGRQTIQPRRRDRRHPKRLVRVRAGAARLRRQHRRDRGPGACRVILRRPARERDDILRHERLCVEDLPNAFEVLAFERRFELDVRLDDDTRHGPCADRHDDPRADDGRRAVWRDDDTSADRAWEWGPRRESAHESRSADLQVVDNGEAEGSHYSRASRLRTDVEEGPARASCLPTPRASRRDCAAGTPDGTSGSAWRRDTRTRGRGAVKSGPGSAAAPACRERAERHDHLRLDDVDLPEEERLAGLDLVLLGIAVLRRPALDDVRDVHVARASGRSPR